MPPLSRLQKIIVGVGACGGVVVYFANYFSPNKRVYNSWTTCYTPNECARWDDNWDHRSPQSLIKPPKKNSSINEINNNLINEELEKYVPTATRHIIMIRHGQYHLSGETDKQRVLTELGRRQAEWTGKRLKELNIPYTELVKSTMTRAQETADIISTSLPDVPTKSCKLLEEGAPIPPVPVVGHWRPERHQFFTDGARIEAAFRKYFHRADVEQKQDSYTILVCHANVIRYFVCRAMQFPPEAWLRISLNNGSITWVSITPTGRVTLRQLSECGYMPPHGITRT